MRRKGKKKKEKIPRPGAHQAAVGHGETDWASVGLGQADWRSRRRFLPVPVPAAKDGRLRRGPPASARCPCPRRSPPPRPRSSSSSCLRRPHPRPPLRGRRLRPPPITANGGTSSESTSTSQVASSASASAAPATRGARAFWGLAAGLVKRRFRHVLDIVGSSVDCNRSTTAGYLLPHLQKARSRMAFDFVAVNEAWEEPVH
ncbi:hypothetical protein BRADI_2g13795v3 [Brachypodium distachyon]|uniref:Uncharacterized protein n=1 Tax=Brachypodium distachyon TaxID=15368 RepID=A0A0Q3FYI8_BRADI|nr:hypothetical protein BRADI_2g13795v3 [Brachypodium distachyon]